MHVLQERGIEHIVFATCSGYTARFCMDRQGLNAVAVTHVCGFEEKGKNELSDSTRAELLRSGIKVLTTTHVLSGAERGLCRVFRGIYPAEIMANTLRMFGQGVKVCVEIAVMALDAGLIPFGLPVVAVGGTAEGADTAVIIKPSHAANILDTFISEILCKPGKM